MKILSHFRFNKRERSGIFFLLFLIILAQGVYFGLGFIGPSEETGKNEVLKGFQKEIDSLKAVEGGRQDTVYPFNPNYISDYKGYVLGMTVEEIDRLHRYRNAGKFVNTTSEFGEVTGVSDSLLRKISPYFRFPVFSGKSGGARTDDYVREAGSAVKKEDLNHAVEADFRSVPGIGEKLSARIVKYRDLLGGYSLSEQLYEVYGLDSTVVKRALQRFEVIEPPVIQKLDINSISLKELASLAYLNREEARKIIAYRSRAGKIKSLDELRKIENFSPGKIRRIKLYLTTE
ncbi:ComEA family DNA-binding protein [Sinomicrobium weinanense]|uniref:Helix-hairpin-helix domain-containing protein n=1 Tax=Sinomicrobium weinanense TaxID=2842200 RepID=A0A926JSH8_9FLAO|nr:helix-hairpin-helix domain-containing protein [Sinomicrobium weinanense]MBC9796499.1 helix-hairpin-helix domain-containing protein [Sinomicrobium weinanense]MBU3123515.1 helix-hairpin-helix domain-containing protein [Sinomicrobium weinanense]